MVNWGISFVPTIDRANAILNLGEHKYLLWDVIRGEGGEGVNDGEKKVFKKSQNCFAQPCNY